MESELEKIRYLVGERGENARQSIIYRMHDVKKACIDFIEQHDRLCSTANVPALDDIISSLYAQVYRAFIDVQGIHAGWNVSNAIMNDFRQTNK